MKLSAITQLDAISELLASQRGECRYCGVTHPVRQCLVPKNATKSTFVASSAYDIWQANQRGSEGVAQRERTARIHWNGYRW